MNVSIGFSLQGFLIILLPMVPNLFYFVFPKIFTSNHEVTKHKILELIEHSSQFLFIALLLLLKSNVDASMESTLILVMSLLLLSYYFLWVLLFLGHENRIVLMCMAIFPIIYFLIAEIWLYNYFAVIPTVIFGITHIMITYLDSSVLRQKTLR